MIAATKKERSNGHAPVMLKEVIESLKPSAGEFMIDGTFGGGGHALEVAKRLSPGGTFLGVDRDPDAANKANIGIQGVKFIFINANFSDIPKILADRNLPKADGLLLDLGFSSLQLEEGRGFSFMKNEPLIMTYSDNDEPLYRVLKRLSREKIRSILLVSGEKYSGKIADAIFRAERKNPIKTTGELIDIVRSVVPKNYERGRIHPATRTFLAFRIYVNKELESLEDVIDSLPRILKPGGRAVIITFQSLEDRIVKNKFRDLEKKGIISVSFKKPLSPSSAEIGKNPRSRSAKMRSAVMK